MSNLLHKKVNICGVLIDNVYMRDALDAIDGFINKRNPILIATLNTDHVVKMSKDVSFKNIYCTATLTITDGVPIVWAARFLGTPIKEKISGADLFPSLCELASQRGRKVFFLGGKEGAAASSAELLRKKLPSLQVSGTYCPSFGFENDEKENTKIIEMIRVASPDILFVGLGAPKQEKWIYKHKNQYKVPVSIGVGAAFDFYSGIVKRAPKWMQNVGLEWFWRLMMEPRRLWKRYLIDDPIFFWLVLKQKFSKKVISS